MRFVQNSVAAEVTRLKLLWFRRKWSLLSSAATVLKNDRISEIYTRNRAGARFGRVVKTDDGVDSARSLASFGLSLASAMGTMPKKICQRGASVLKNHCP
jgi:hypothetical protein